MGISYNSNIVTDGLVLCLDAANPRSYPGSGTTWTDLSGNGYNGTLQGDTSYVSSNNGGLYLDGTGDYITLGTKNFITNDFSLSMWIKPTHSTKELYLFSFGYSSTGSALFWVGQNTRVLRAGFYNGSDLNYGETTGTISNNIFYYVTWNREGTTNTLYINGQPDGTFSRSDSIASVIYDIGWATTRNKSTAYHQGDIYTTSIYNRSLSADEISQNFNATRHRFGV